MASANDLPDFANLSKLDDTTALNLANQGILLPINEILEKGDGTALNFIDNEVPFVRGTCTAADGNMYWIPVAQKTTYAGKPASTARFYLHDDCHPSGLARCSRYGSPQNG